MNISGETIIETKYQELKHLNESYFLAKQNDKCGIIDIENNEKEYNEQEIIDQSLEVGTKVSEGDKIILYIPNILEGYPNMQELGWSLEDVEAFCNQYELQLTIEYQETSQYAKGMIISQSRAPKSPIVKGATLKVIIAKEASTGNPTGDPNLNDLVPQPSEDENLNQETEEKE